MLTYNNAATVAAVVDAVPRGPREALRRHLGGADQRRRGLVGRDRGAARRGGLPLVRARTRRRRRELAAVPFHGVPGRGAALRLALGVAQRLGARALVVLEADVMSITDEWLERLWPAVLERGADLVVPVHARHRYDGTITTSCWRRSSARFRAAAAPALRGRAGAVGARSSGALVAEPRWPIAGRG